MFSLLSNSFYLYMYRKPIHVANSLIWGPVGSNPSTAYLFNSSVFHMGGLHCHPNHYLSSLNFVSNKPHLLTLKVVWDPGLMILMWIKVHYLIEILSLVQKSRILQNLIKNYISNFFGKVKIMKASVGLELILTDL